MRELICIVCPKGCHLQVDEENGCRVTGNACPRGAVYGREELLNPVRTVTTTMRCLLYTSGEKRGTLGCGACGPDFGPEPQGGGGRLYSPIYPCGRHHQHAPAGAPPG